MATVFDPSAVRGNVMHNSTIEEANTLAQTLEMFGYNCKTKDKSGLGLILVKGGSKRPKLIIEVNRGEVCGLPELAIGVRAEKPEFGHHYDWVSGVILRDPRDGQTLLDEAFHEILKIAGETAWQKNVRENRGRDDDESYM